MESQKTLITKVIGHGKMHISTKNGIKILKFSMELAQTMVTWIESQVNSCLVPFFVKSFYLKPWYVMFGIFPRYYISYHDSMPWISIFLNFLNFLNSICPHFKSRSNSRCLPCVLGGWGTKVWNGF
jgi:hypothetical protein